MNNLQLYLTIGIPSFLVILSWVSNRADNAALRADYQRLAERLDKGLESMRAEMIALRGQVNAEFANFRRETNAEFVTFRREIHADMIPLHERMAKVEVRQEKD